MFKNKRCIVIGGAGFIGSHIADALLAQDACLDVIDNMRSGNFDNLSYMIDFFRFDIRDFKKLCGFLKDTDYVFLTAAIARTPWCIKDPILCYETNVMGTLNVLEACRLNNVKRVVLSSSNVVYAFDTPYRTSKEALERLKDTYVAMYGQSVIALRYSNVYGKRQSELGESPNVFAALRKSKKETGALTITGDGEQSRDYTHVSDIVEGNLKAALSDNCGTIDLCTGVNTSLNEVAKYFECPVNYVEERPGDIKHIRQDPKPAKDILGWEYSVPLSEGIKDVL